ncbi:MAG: DJ-1/PfpI family protein, partial [Methanobacteriaceae archaeon]|nr:DJ-1/PfpI family protein [Methanobacteriaceae archaeon]
MKIGLTYLKGTVPGFEDFGNLPTNLIKSNGLINGLPIHKELDALIIPGGTLIESNSLNENIFKEIKLMAKEGKPIIGICAGYQILGNQIDIGRNSPSPIIK